MAIQVDQVKSFTEDDLLCDYFDYWIDLFKKGAVRDVTLEKYVNNANWLRRIAPDLKMSQVNRNTYQKILNAYAVYHEKQTVIDFHHQVKSMIIDAVDEHLIDRDPTRKAIFKGKAPGKKHKKFLNQFELHNLLEDLDLTTGLHTSKGLNYDWLILLIAKTGMRFSEAIAVTPHDFDFRNSTVSVNKTWNWKHSGGFMPTKNRSSVRVIPIDFQLAMQFQQLIKGLPDDEAIFGTETTCNSTPNHALRRHCKNIGCPVITLHGLRHTHASLLMGAGVSIASISKRLGHSSITTTQKVYLHLINEMENKDNDLIMRYLSGLS